MTLERAARFPQVRTAPDGEAREAHLISRKELASKPDDRTARTRERPVKPYLAWASDLPRERTAAIERAVDRYGRDMERTLTPIEQSPWARGGAYDFIFGGDPRGAAGLPERPSDRGPAIPSVGGRRSFDGIPTAEQRFRDSLAAIVPTSGGRGGWRGWLTGGGRMPGGQRDRPEEADGRALAGGVVPDFSSVGQGVEPNTGPDTADPLPPSMREQLDTKHLLEESARQVLEETQRSFKAALERPSALQDAHDRGKEQRAVTPDEIGKVIVQVANTLKAYLRSVEKVLEDAYRQRAAEEERKKQQSPPPKPGGASNPNPEDPDGPVGPWVRHGLGTRVGPPDPEGGGPIGPWVRPVEGRGAVAGRPDPEGDGPVGPWVRPVARSRIGDLWMPNPEDPGSPIGPAVKRFVEGYRARRHSSLSAPSPDQIADLLQAAVLLHQPRRID